MNFLYLFRIENKLKPHEKLCRDHGCFCMVMLEKSNDILKYNQDKVNSRAQLIIYVYTESLLEKKGMNHAYDNNSEKSYTTKQVI